jgi:hypothetical protein
MSDDRTVPLTGFLSDLKNPELADVVARANITTLEGLFAELNKPTPSLPADAVSVLQRSLMDHFAVAGITAQEEVELISKRDPASLPVLQTGLDSLDELLAGSGFSTHTVAEISGISGSGKTVSHNYFVFTHTSHEIYAFNRALLFESFCTT